MPAVGAPRVWERLYGALPVEEKISAAFNLFRASRNEDRVVVWIFEWLLGGGAIPGKRPLLPIHGVELLCDLLAALAPAYPLGHHAPVLLLQLRAPLEVVLPPADSHNQGAGSTKGRPQVILSEIHAKLAGLLLQRPLLSFRPSTDQALPILVAAAERLAGADEARSEAASRVHLQMVVACARLLVRSLDGAIPKNTFKALVSALPSVALVLAAAPPQHLEEMWEDVDGNRPRAAAAPSPNGDAACWQVAIVVTQTLLRGLFDQSHLEGFEVLLRSKEGQQEMKRARKAQAADAPEDGGIEHYAYCAALFKCIGSELLGSDNLRKADSISGAVAVLPVLLLEYIRAQRQQAAIQAATALEDAEMRDSKKRGAPEPTTIKTPCEFCFFRKLASVLEDTMGKLSADPAEREQADKLVQGLVVLWRHVRVRGVFRLREDPDGLQRKSLDGFVLTLLARLAERTPLEARDAPEWSGLLEVLWLDASPFEERLADVWSLLINLSPKDSVSAEKHSRSASTGGTILAVELLKKYAQLADLPSCLSALASALRRAPEKRASRFFAEHDLASGLEEVAGVVSGASAGTQAIKLWEDLLIELDRQLSWWALTLLQFCVRGLRPSVLSLEPFQDLLLRSFASVEEWSSGVSVPPRHCLDGVLVALCILGRRLGAWELPLVLHPLQGKAAEIAKFVAEGLNRLARSLCDESALIGQEAFLKPVVDGAAVWIAMKEEHRRERSLQAADCDTDADLPLHVVACTLLRLTASAEDQAVRRMTRQVVCTRVALFATLAARPLNAGGLPASGTDELVGVLVPPSLACWRFLAQSWGSHQHQSCGSSNQAAVLQLLHDKDWGPAASLWACELWVLAEHKTLGAAVLERLAGLIADAAVLPTASTEKQCKQRIAGLAGLLEALYRLAKQPWQQIRAAVHVDLFQSLAACVALACQQLHGKDSSGGADTYAMHVLLTSLKTISCLLESHVSEKEGRSAISDVSAEPTAEKAVAMFTGLGGNAGDSSKQPVAESVLSLLSEGVLQESDDTLVAEALAQLVCAMIRKQGASAWEMSGRKDWLVKIIGRLAGPSFLAVALGCRGECRISLPHPRCILTGGNGEKKRREAFRGHHRSLRILKAFLGACADVSSASGDAVASSLRLVLRIDWDALDCRDSVCNVMSAKESDLTSASLVLALLAHAVELRCGMEAAAHSVGRRVECIRMVAEVVAVLRAHVGAAGAASEKYQVAEVCNSIGLIIRALCSIHWPKDEEDEIWEGLWLPLLIDWVELSGSFSQSVLHASICAAGTGADLETDAAASAPQSLAMLCQRHSGIGRQRLLIVRLAGRLAATAAALAGTEDSISLTCRTSVVQQQLLGLASGLAAVLHRLPRLPTIAAEVAGSVLAAGRAALAASDAKLFSPTAPGGLEASARVGLHVSEAIAGLYTHLAAPLLHVQSQVTKPHSRLAAAEATLLHTAGHQARTALELLRSAASKSRVADFASETSPVSGPLAARLLTAVYIAMSALFSAVPLEGRQLPDWAAKPHIVIEILKALLEAVYIAGTGGDAARVAGDIARLWEAFCQGGTRLVAHSAGATGKSSYQARVQRATKSSAIMIIAHYLEQQRRWGGIEASVNQSLAHLDPQARMRAHDEEAAKWKEVVSVLQTGITPVLASLDTSEHLKQSLYSSLREPLSSMFKEANEAYEKRAKYSGEA